VRNTAWSAALPESGRRFLPAQPENAVTPSRKLPLTIVIGPSSGAATASSTRSSEIRRFLSIKLPRIEERRQVETPHVQGVAPSAVVAISTFPSAVLKWKAGAFTLRTKV